jgi:uncharacterized protein
MAFEMGPETRQVQAMWDVSTYKYKIDGRGMKVLVDAMKDKKIKGIKCPQCGRVYVPGPTFCRDCFIDIDEIVEVKDTGTIISFAVELTDVRGKPLDEWRASAMIKLDGADSFIGGTVKVDDWHDVHIDQKVKAVWADEPVGSLSDIDHFEPV